MPRRTVRPLHASTAPTRPEAKTQGLHGTAFANSSRTCYSTGKCNSGN